MSDFFRSISVAASGLKAQAGRMRIIAENIANTDSTPASRNESPYRRKIPTFERRFDVASQTDMVNLGRTKRDQSEFRTRLDPGHPAADANGYVKLPNVNSLVENMDMREAQRSYEANINVISATRRMIARTLEILRA